MVPPRLLQRHVPITQQPNTIPQEIDLELNRRMFLSRNVPIRIYRHDPSPNKDQLYDDLRHKT